MDKITLTKLVQSDTRFKLQVTPFLPVSYIDHSAIKFLMFKTAYDFGFVEIIPEVTYDLMDSDMNIHVVLYKDLLFYSLDCHELISKIYLEEKGIQLPSLDEFVPTLRNAKEIV